MSLATTILLFAGGIVTGTVGALLGIGGGVFLIPFLVLVTQIPMHQAIATSIVAVIATSSAAATVNLRRQLVNMRLGMSLEIATVGGAILGGITANYLSGAILSKIFATLLLVVAGILLRRIGQNNSADQVSTEGTYPGQYVDDASGKSVSYGVRRIPGTMAVSLLAGNISGLLGVGGGVFKVPAMHLISGVPMKAATATSNFMIGVTAAASAFIYFSNGHLNPAIASASALGVLVGSNLGVRLGRRIHSNVLTKIFAFALLAIAVRMYFR